jgi:hypothetical protein
MALPIADRALDEFEIEVRKEMFDIEESAGA